MKTSLECIPCLVRQSLDAVRFFTSDANLQARMMRDVLRGVAEFDLQQPPPVVGQRIHRWLREVTGDNDPYREAKDRFNRFALALLPELAIRVRSADDPFGCSVRLAIAGNIIDLGLDGGLKEEDVRLSLLRVESEPFEGDLERFRSAVAAAGQILYLTDNAGEIVFDRLLIEQFQPSRVVVAVRGAPVMNDATAVDAMAAGLDRIAEVIDNGSDAPGTLLEDCSPIFRKHFERADLVIAKGQGNFETLSDHSANIFFLLKIKCPLVAAHTRLPLGTHTLIRGGVSSRNPELEESDKKRN